MYTTSKRVLAQALCVGAFVTVALASAVARADSGSAAGVLKFHQVQGNYCEDDGRDCTGAHYLEADNEELQPLRDIQVQIVNASNTAEVWGQGVTNSAGGFWISWNSGSSGTQAKILWKARHKDTRFEIRSYSSNGIMYGTTTSVTLTGSGGYTNVGTYNWGSSGSPNYTANLYDGAYRMWANALTYSGLMGSRFTSVQVLTYGPLECPTSCAAGKRIVINSTDAVRKPQARILHEMGHVASELANNGRRSVPYYNYPASTIGGSWSLNTAEWKAASFEEGMATFLGDVALYSYNNDEPKTCNSTGSCSLTAFDTEDSSGQTCPTGEDRWALTTTRYLRDLYDSHADASWDDAQYSFWKILAALNRFPSGYHDHERDEPYNKAFGFEFIDNLDGRTSHDFYYHFDANYGQCWIERLNNCSP